MRRDYFTCVFLASIVGALAFVCFKPIYFKFDVIVPRSFGWLELTFSILYTLLLLVVLPVYSSYKKKHWICIGLASYGLLAYIPDWFYPDVLRLGPGEVPVKEPGLGKVLLGAVLRSIDEMVNAPFAAMSKVVGNNIAWGLSKWILPIAVIVPIFFLLFRFYRNAYVQEQLNPVQVVDAPTRASKKPEVEPEVLGTVISAPTSAASPEEVSRKAAASNKEKTVSKTVHLFGGHSGDQPTQMKQFFRRGKNTPALKAEAEPESKTAVRMVPPSPVNEEVIELPAHSPSSEKPRVREPQLPTTDSNENHQ